MERAALAGAGAAPARVPAPSRLRDVAPPRPAPRQRHLARAAVAPPAAAPPAPDANQRAREGSYEAPLVRLQAAKADPEQPPIASALAPVDLSATSDVVVVGCGPAGLALAAELAGQGLSVALVGHDRPFVNNYGVWEDEFRALGLEHTLDHVWADAVCYFREGREVRVGRAYGRVCRRRLRAHLLRRCADAGVRFLAGEVEGVDTANAGGGGGGGAPPAAVRVRGGAVLGARLVTLASGAAAGRLLRYDPGSPGVAAQTAYGIEAEVEGYGDAFDPGAMLFMDYRRHHTGLYPGTARRQRPGQHPNGAAGLWGTGGETPSFLYAMPLGGGRVFLEETCLVAKPALPFAVLKRRLERRCEALGIKVGCRAGAALHTAPSSCRGRFTCIPVLCAFPPPPTPAAAATTPNPNPNPADQGGPRGGVELHPHRRPAPLARPAAHRVWRRRQPRPPRYRLLHSALPARGARHGARRGRGPPRAAHLGGGGALRVGGAVDAGEAAAGGLPRVRHGAAVRPGPGRHRRLLHHLLRAAHAPVARLPGQRAELGGPAGLCHAQGSKPSWWATWPPTPRGAT